MSVAIKTLVTEKPVRQCSGCTECCRLLPMQSDTYPPEQVAETAREMVKAGWATAESFRGMMVDFNKPAGERCPHQSHKGCKVYAQRPFGCRYWNCRWLVNDDCADLRRPDRSHVVIDIMPDYVVLDPGDGSPPTNVEVVQLWCDERYPDAWRDPSILAYLDRRGREGKLGLIRFNAREAITVFPPSMTSDGQWHELDRRAALSPQHTGDTLIGGLAQTRKVRFNVGDF